MEILVIQLFGLLVPQLQEIIRCYLRLQIGIQLLDLTFLQLALVFQLFISLTKLIVFFLYMLQTQL